MQNNIRLAEKDDLPAIMDIVAETITLMKQDDNPQWSEGYPTESTFLNDINHKALYVYIEGDSLQGFVCVDDNQPPEYAGPAWSSDEAAYCLHRLAIHPRARGKGLAKILIKHVESIALKNGVYNIRSDTFSGNKGMNALFVGCGYHKVGEINFRGITRPFYCYEKLNIDKN